jgi:hypothetical protein
MTMYSDARGRVVDVGSSPGLRLLGLGISAFLVVIFLFASVTRVQSGHVLTLFGRVTGEVLPEGHARNQGISKCAERRGTGHEP